MLRQISSTVPQFVSMVASARVRTPCCQTQTSAVGAWWVAILLSHCSSRMAVEVHGLLGDPSVYHSVEVACVPAAGFATQCRTCPIAQNTATQYSACCHNSGGGCMRLLMSCVVCMQSTVVMLLKSPQRNMTLLTRLDVWVDNVTRGLLWTMALPHGLGLWPVVLEMTTFLVTHKVGLCDCLT